MNINEIDKKYGTPMYLYDKNIICNNYKRLRSSILPEAKLFYSMKANPVVGICKMLHDMGAGIEVASGGELSIALKAGIPASDIVFSGPGKTESEIQKAVASDIKMINTDSLDEIAIVDRIAAEQHKIMKVGIRINPAVSFSNAKIKMSGVASQFGVEEEKIDMVLNEIHRFENIKVCGFQIYMGTQMLLAEDIIQNTEYALELFLRLANKHSIQLEVANVGGGFGVKYFEKENDLDLEELKTRMNDLYEKYKSELDNTEIIFESGRFVMAESGRFITKVLYVKESKGVKYVVCDGGANFHSSAAFLGRFVRNNFPITTFPESDEKEAAVIVGPLCTPIDILGQNVMISKNIKKGDYVIVEKSGAYGLTYSPLAFLSHSTPVEILKDDDEYQILRKSTDISEWLKSEEV